MGKPQFTHAPEIKILIGGKDYYDHFLTFEWMAMANGGYVARARMIDPNMNILEDLAKDQLLPKARKEPLEMEFQLGWAGGPKMKTTTKAWVTDVASDGRFYDNETEVIAIDPPSWALNAGKSKGEAYKGNVTQVIRDVCNKYAIKGAPNLKKITETKDDKNNHWWMMRQDPKTFIQMLLDWSSSVTPKKTNWVVASKNLDLHVVEQADVPNLKFGTYEINVRPVYQPSDARHVTMQSDVLTNFWQAKLVTQGMSAISGKYFDKITEEKKVTVEDEDTPNKINANCDSDESFSKPDKDWSASILAIPEHNAGDVGLDYGDYVDGRVRNMYISQLNIMHRIKLRVQGDIGIDDPLGLDGTAVKLLWKNEFGRPYWLGGNWIIYGFHHIASRQEWHTDLYLRRYDFNATAEKRSASG